MNFWPKRGTQTKRVGKNLYSNDETERKKLCGHDRQRVFICASCMDVIQCISNYHHHGCSREITFYSNFVKEMKVLFLSRVPNLSRSNFKIPRTRPLAL
jgi:hypothetical protein